MCIPSMRSGTGCSKHRESAENATAGPTQFSKLWPKQPPFHDYDHYAKARAQELSQNMVTTHGVLI
jgi:hypothetical protein